MQTDTEQVALISQITAADVKAMKEANYMVLFYRPDGSEGPTWGMRLGREIRLDETIAYRLLTRIAKDQAWHRTSADEHSVKFIRVLGAAPQFCQIERHAKSGGDVIEAVWLSPSLHYADKHHRTALNAFRAGDVFGVHFVGSNNTQNHDSVGFHADECYLRVIRKGNLVGEFFMGYQVGPDNSARMVRS